MDDIDNVMQQLTHRGVVLQSKTLKSPGGLHCEDNPAPIRGYLGANRNYPHDWWWTIRQHTYQDEVLASFWPQDVLSITVFKDQPTVIKVETAFGPISSFPSRNITRRVGINLLPAQLRPPEPRVTVSTVEGRVVQLFVRQADYNELIGSGILTWYSPDERWEVWAHMFNPGCVKLLNDSFGFRKMMREKFIGAFKPDHVLVANHDARSDRIDIYVSQVRDWQGKPT